MTLVASQVYEVVLLGSATCMHCAVARALFYQHGITSVEVEAESAEGSVLLGLTATLLSYHSLPQIFVTCRSAAISASSWTFVGGRSQVASACQSIGTANVAATTTTGGVAMLRALLQQGTLIESAHLNELLHAAARRAERPGDGMEATSPKSLSWFLDRLEPPKKFEGDAEASSTPREHVVFEIKFAELLHAVRQRSNGASDENAAGSILPRRDVGVLCWVKKDAFRLAEARQVLRTFGHHKGLRSESELARFIREMLSWLSRAHAIVPLVNEKNIETLVDGMICHDRDEPEWWWTVPSSAGHLSAAWGLNSPLCDGFAAGASHGDPSSIDRNGAVHEPIDTVEFSSVLCNRIGHLIARHVSVPMDKSEADGAAVDCAVIVAQSKEFTEFLVGVSMLRRLDLTALSTSSSAARAFWINIYNACVRHAFVQRGPPGTNPVCLYRFFHNVGYEFNFAISNLTVTPPPVVIFTSLDTIENGLLRGNRPGVGSWSPPLAQDDQRLLFTLGHNIAPQKGLPRLEVDYRVHFALNCGARSCPPVENYQASTIDQALDRAMVAFVQTNTTYAAGVLHVSKIFDWYRVDFPGNDGGSDGDAALVDLLRPHLDESMEKQLEAFLGPAPHVKKVTVRFSDYDWTPHVQFRL